MRQVADPLPDPDRDAVERYLAGEGESVFLELYDRHTPALFQFALRIVGGSTADAEDAVQEAWLRASERLEEFRWDSSLRTWLTSFTLNCAREVLRRRPRRRRDGKAAAVRASSPPTILAAVDLERALARLPDDFRIALVLHDVEGFTHAEIGRLLGIEEGTSRSRVHRARRALRPLLRP